MSLIINAILGIILFGIIYMMYINYNNSKSIKKSLEGISQSTEKLISKIS